MLLNFLFPILDFNLNLISKDIHLNLTPKDSHLNLIPKDIGFPQQQFPVAPQIPISHGNGYPSAPYQPPRKIEYVLSFDWAPRTTYIHNLATSKGIVRIGNCLFRLFKVVSQKIADLSADASN